MIPPYESACLCGMWLTARLSAGNRRAQVQLSPPRCGVGHLVGVVDGDITGARARINEGFRCRVGVYCNRHCAGGAAGEHPVGFAARH